MKRAGDDMDCLFDQADTTRKKAEAVLQMMIKG